MTADDLARVDRPVEQLEADLAESARPKAMPMQECVLGGLLAGLPDAPPQVAATVGASLVRATLRLVPDLEPMPPSADYADTLAAGHTESLNTWAERVLGRTEGGL